MYSKHLRLIKKNKKILNHEIDTNIKILFQELYSKEQQHNIEHAQPL